MQAGSSGGTGASTRVKGKFLRLYREPNVVKPATPGAGGLLLVCGLLLCSALADREAWGRQGERAG